MGHTVVEHVGAMSFRGHGKSGHDVPMDAARENGGTDAAARPLEVLLCALGGCTGMDVVSILRKMKSEPDSLCIEIEDERAPEYPKAITKLHLIYTIAGAVPRENALKAVELSLSKYCPIASTLSGVARITSEVRLV